MKRVYFYDPGLVCRVLAWDWTSIFTEKNMSKIELEDHTYFSAFWPWCPEICLYFLLGQSASHGVRVDDHSFHICGIHFLCSMGRLDTGSIILLLFHHCHDNRIWRFGKNKLMLTLESRRFLVWVRYPFLQGICLIVKETEQGVSITLFT